MIVAMNTMNWHSLKLKELFAQLESSEGGLAGGDAKNRLQKYGFNSLVEAKKKHALMMFLEEFADFLVLLLIAAAIVSAFIGELIDAIAIISIVILNAIFGFTQEYQAEKAIDSLKKLVAPKALVLRNGEEKMIDASELVPGDVLLLSEGAIVPADARILESIELNVIEASLTGESLPVRKIVGELPEKTALADRKNMVFMTTSIASGRGKAIVVSTGMNTEVGKIAGLVQGVEAGETPLQQRLAVMGKRLGVIALAASAFVFIIGLLRGFQASEIFLISVSLAVAAIPEGLPAIVTITLAIGTKRMADKNSIIRKLAAVETLGSANVICSDKTGTLTRNEMTCKEVWLGNKNLEVSGIGYAIQGKFLEANSRETNVGDKNLKYLLECACACNNAKLEGSGIIGDPTEASLLVMAGKAGYDYNNVQKEWTFKNEFPFTSERKMMSVLRSKGKEQLLFSKGAPEILLAKCTRILVNGREQALTPGLRKKILEENSRMASKALRVLGFSYRKFLGGKTEEKDLTFLGLVGMIDPPRPEAVEAVAKCIHAGIRAVMITGDNKQTALAVAREVGINTSAGALSGDELDELSEKQLDDKIQRVSVYARVSPEHKLRLIDSLKRKGFIVAMTGDGVNDAPAIKKADIGIGMGITGTDVTKETADMIITDDNFASIVNAVEQGRIVYDNISKSVLYLVSCNTGELMTIFFGIMLGLPAPLVAIQILWMNLVTDGLPALALGFEPGEAGIMLRKPRDAKEEILNKNALKQMLFIGGIITLGTLGLFYYYLKYSVAEAETVAFTTIIFFQLFYAMESRSKHEKLLDIGLLSNKVMLLAIGVAALLQVAIVQTSLFDGVFKTTPLEASDWLIIIAVSSLSLLIPEALKYFRKEQKAGERN